AAAIRGAENPKRLEDLYLPYKPKKKTKASEARDKGLEPLAVQIWHRDETLLDLNAAAAAFVDAEKGLESVEKVLEGVGYILAEAISELANVRDSVRRVVWKTGKIVTTKGDSIPEGEGLEYRDYFAYSEPIAHIPPHRVLAINRGDKEGPLKVKLEVSRPEVEGAVFRELPLEGHPQAETFRAAAMDALDRLLLPSMEREVRRDLTESAERHAVDVFARNLRSLLLQPPIAKQVVLAIDPGLKSGCKLAVLDDHGNLLEHGVIHPHPPQNRRHEAKQVLKELVGKHKVGVVAIGNGTACRETEELVAEIISEGTFFYTNPGVTSMGPEPAASAAPAAVDEPAATIVPPAEPAADAQTTAESIPAAVTDYPGAAAPPETVPFAAPPEAGVQAPYTEPPPEPTETPAEGETEHHVVPPVEELPPLSGGSSEADEEAPTLAAEGPETPEDHTPPPSSTPEANAPEAEAQVADLLAKDESTANPAAGEMNGDATATEPPAPVETTAPEAPAAPEGPATPEQITEEFARAKEAVKDKPRPGGGRPPKPKGEQRPPKPKGPPPPPRPHAADEQLAQLAYVIVNEAGASVYSTSTVGREEFHEFDATLRGTVSIGRRLQDPLAELVKIEPQNIGVGLYQHDVNPKQLKESLEGVISSCVNFVGVDLNTASVPLLRHVSGLNQLTARRVVDRRQEKGPFTDRSQLAEIEGVGPVTYTQAAGFLKIPGAANPLDKTWVHPESYEVATKVLEKFGFTPEILTDRARLPELHAKMNEADLPALAGELGVGEPTLHDIFEALARPDRDPRDDLPKPIFKTGVLKLEDLSPGMELKGTVLNVVDFGAFVDIGLKDSGLVHISQLANRYIKSPHDVVSVGDVVTVWVLGVDNERKRVSLTMVKPGTERPRPERGPGGGRGRGEPRGGERRGPAQGQGGGRPPRPPVSAPSPQLQAPPAGSPQGGPGMGQGQGAGPGGGDRRPSDRIPTRGAAGGGGRPGGPSSRGPRPGGPGGGQGRFDRSQRPPQQPAMPPRPSKPAPPPPPLSKDALAGSVPLRSFGQLKQLWQARVEEPGEEGSAEGQAPTNSEASANAEAPPQVEPTNESHPTPDQSPN
ncbi:MAG TPA: Tex-like N-terminal domain-containing protein, partial [Isosphaeraceae bacterium]